MKQRNRTNLKQTELFCEPARNEVLVPLRLALSQEAELKKTIAELLLNLARADAPVAKGDPCDE